MVQFSIETEEETTPIQQALSEKETGTDSHQVYIDKVLEDDGNNPWLWCSVMVTARFKGLEGTAYLGQCAYENVADFKKGGYYEQMQDEAFEELKKKVDEIVTPFIVPMREVIEKLIESLPELNDEETPLDGSQAVDVLCGLWEELKESVQ